MEDVFLSLWLASSGEVVVAPRDPGVAAPLGAAGIVRQTLRNWTLTALAAAGVHPDQLARFYPVRPVASCRGAGGSPAGRLPAGDRLHHGKKGLRQGRGKSEARGGVVGLVGCRRRGLEGGIEGLDQGGEGGLGVDAADLDGQLVPWGANSMNSSMAFLPLARSSPLQTKTSHW